MSAINKDQKLGVVPNLFRFEWNQVSQISFKLKSLVFHSALEGEPLATWHARYFGFLKRKDSCDGVSRCA